MNKIILFLFLLFFIPYILSAQSLKHEGRDANRKAQNRSICESQTCEKWEEVDICIVDSSLDDGIRNFLTVKRACGYWTETHFTSSMSEITDVLSEMASSCKKLKKLMFLGHANQVDHGAGLSLLHMENLSSYSCLLVPNIEVEFMGCNTGNECLGDMSMYNLARNLLHENGGTVIGYSSYVMALAGVTPLLSIDGKKRHLEYRHPSKMVYGRFSF